MRNTTLYRKRRGLNYMKLISMLNWRIIKEEERQKFLLCILVSYNAYFSSFNRINCSHVDHSNTEDTIATSLDQLQLDIDKNKDDLNTFLGEKIEPKKSNKPKKEKEKKKSKKKSGNESATAFSLPPPGLSSSDEDDRRVEILQDEDYEDFP